MVRDQPQRPRSFAEWRDMARPWLAAGVPVDGIDWDVGTPRAAAGDVAGRPAALKIPAALMSKLENISCYRTAGRYEFMYRLTWRTLFENPRLFEDAADPDVMRALLMDSAIRRDIHKMHAFVRFREFLNDTGEREYFAWFEPEHEILRKGSTFFVKRFPNMRWTIATPEGAALWDLSELRFVRTDEAAARPPSDGHEDLWRTYYRSICNVARINPQAMQREMPQKYWRNLPESAEIGVLLRQGAEKFAANHKVSDESKRPPARGVQRALADLPPPGDGPQECRRCDLWKHATQAVMGEGQARASIMMVGEQPGDEEDLRGHPFVGPAGKVLDQALAAVGLQRPQVFITNAVKHFKWEPRGKRRLHKKPDLREVNACNVWLQQEIAAVQPRVIVALGATALRALMGATLSIDAARRQTLAHPSGIRVLATYHPSAILRSEGDRIEQLRSALIADLNSARQLAHDSSGAGPATGGAAS